MGECQLLSKTSFLNSTYFMQKHRAPILLFSAIHLDCRHFIKFCDHRVYSQNTIVFISTVHRLYPSSALPPFSPFSGLSRAKKSNITKAQLPFLKHTEQSHFVLEEVTEVFGSVVSATPPKTKLWKCFVVKINIQFKNCIYCWVRHSHIFI